MMKEIRIKVQCLENEHHAKILKLDPALGEEFAHCLADLLDGSSPFYVHPPGGRDNVQEWPGDKGSPIGHCAICGARFKCTVIGIAEGVEPAIREVAHAKY